METLSKLCLLNAALGPRIETSKAWNLTEGDSRRTQAWFSTWGTFQCLEPGHGQGCGEAELSWAPSEAVLSSQT